MMFTERYEKGFVHLVVLSVFLLSALSLVVQQKVLFTWQLGLAAGLTLVCWLFWWKNPERLWPVLLMTLLAAALELAAFGNPGFYFHLHIGIDFSGFYLLLFLQACYMRRDHLLQWSPLGTKNVEEHANEREGRIQFFMRQFRSKPEAELRAIASGAREVVSEAREAADRLLKERGSEAEAKEKSAGS